MLPDDLPDTLRVAIGTAITPAQAALIAAGNPRLEVLYDPALMPPQRYENELYIHADWHLPPADQERFEAMCTSAHVLFGVPHDSATLLHRVVEANPNLIWLHTMAAGGGAQLRAANLAPADLDRLIVTTSAGTHGQALTEFAVLGALAGAKQLPWMQDNQQAHEWAPQRPMRMLFEMTVVVVGLGGIGREVAQRFQQFGATVIGVNRTLKDVPGVQMHTDDDLIEVAARADVLVNCLPAAIGTDNLISADVLAAAKPGCIVVSVGRGSCIDESALVAGLASGRLAYAALDVTAHEPLDPASPLWDMPNVLISPHTAAICTSQIYRIIDLFLDNTARLLDGRPMRNLVNKQLFY
ncbi:MAG: D-2-hydroxyacid dehydrogenase [Propionibacteriaceae bacterium]|nr:D-2-hydroxyacid dehydrogenase [Propionibacteriaceae bacterium]